MTYQTELERSEKVRSVPWDTVSRKVSWDSFLGRSVAERNLFEGGVLPVPENGRAVATLAVLVDGADGQGLKDTLHCWGLQSCPAVALAILPCDREGAERVPALLASSPWAGKVAVWSGPEALRDGLTSTEFVLFARPGDMHHPSLATVLATMSRFERSDVVVWNDLALPARGSNGAPVGVRRRPQLERFTLRHVPYVGRAFAMRAEVLQAYPHSLAEELRRKDGHPVHLWLAEQPQRVWRTHPETLSATVPTAESDTGSAPDAPMPKSYSDVLRAIPDVKTVPCNSGSLPYYLEPRPHPRSISVIIPFRDRPELTRRCLESLFQQDCGAALEIILVDNESKPASVRAVQEFASSKGGGVPFRIIRYDHPFNHSRQCNLGIRESSGDVIVLMNNDAVMATPEGIEQMASWALVEGVGTVGCRITTPKGQLVSAGIRARLEVRGDLRTPPCEESTDGSYADVIRETVGNSFACAAMTRRVYDAAGPLNDTEFPNGYNDVEYSLRLTRAGLKHLYLGPVVVHHKPRTSRGPCDESLQTVLLRARYPEVSSLGSFQLEFRLPVEAAQENGHGPLGKIGRWILSRGGIARAARAFLGKPAPAEPPPESVARPQEKFPFDGFLKNSMPVAFVDPLSDADLKALNLILPWHSFTVDARGRRFGAVAWAGKRDLPQVIQDWRQAKLNELIPLAGKHVLEIGCFEGVHTIGLCRLAGRVTAVDSRIENVVKTIVRCALSDCRPTVFVCDVERRPLNVARLAADVVHHVGVLYHLADPVRHLEDLCGLVGEGLLLDTHCASDTEARNQYKVGGRLYRYKTYTEKGVSDPFSGMYPFSKWLTLASIREILARGGLSKTEWIQERAERNGNRVSIIVRRER